MPQYRIVLNSVPSKESEEYSYSFGSIKNIQLVVGRQASTITFVTKTRRTADDFIRFRYYDFRDSYRKAILIHALLFDTGFHVCKIKIIVDGDETVYDYQHDPIGRFPYMFSMIRNDVDLALDDSWKILAPLIAHTTKTNVDKDVRFSAVYSFLAAKNRLYFIDVLTNLWTSMNALYKYIETRYEKAVEQKLASGSLSTKESRKLRRDSESIQLMKRLIDPCYIGISNRKEVFDESYRLESTLRKYSPDDIRELYEEAEKELSGGIISERFKEISRYAELFNEHLYVFMLFTCPYQLRCRYFHGETPTVLISAYKDSEICVLEAVNYFLSRFLNERIPMLFDDTLFCEQIEKEAIRFLENSKG